MCTCSIIMVRVRRHGLTHRIVEGCSAKMYINNNNRDNRKDASLQIFKYQGFCNRFTTVTRIYCWNHPDPKGNSLRERAWPWYKCYMYIFNFIGWIGVLVHIHVVLHIFTYSFIATNLSKHLNGLPVLSIVYMYISECVIGLTALDSLWLKAHPLLTQPIPCLRQAVSATPPTQLAVFFQGCTCSPCQLWKEWALTNFSTWKKARNKRHPSDPVPESPTIFSAHISPDLY